MIRCGHKRILRFFRFLSSSSFFSLSSRRELLRRFRFRSSDEGLNYLDAGMLAAIQRRNGDANGKLGLIIARAIIRLSSSKFRRLDRIGQQVTPKGWLSAIPKEIAGSADKKR